MSNSECQRQDIGPSERPTKRVRLARTVAAVIGVCILLAALCVALVHFKEYPTRNELRETMRRWDPTTQALKPGFNSYVECAELKDGTQVGIIHLRDGSSSKFWFRSHHLAKDIGGTWFRMSDGQETYMAGWFCCEVQLPEEQVASLAELRRFIREHHGLSP